MGNSEKEKSPLLPVDVPSASCNRVSNNETEHEISRTGTLTTAIAHIITAVIGSGVLSLAWSVAQMGWVAGPLVIVAFGAVTAVQSGLIADLYRSPDPEHGLVRCRTYMDAVGLYLGQGSQWICWVQYLSLWGGCIAYTLTSAKSTKAILQSNCYHSQGHSAPCLYDAGDFMLLFGAVQIAFLLIPDLGGLGWLSAVSAAMSFTYASIGFGLGLGNTIRNGVIKGSIGGVPEAASQKVRGVSEALGDIAFAYPFSIVLLEIQDTLRSPPPENRTMKRACRISIFITTIFYLLCGCSGYAAFGDGSTPGNLLTGFGFYEPYWLVDLANACVVVHLVGAYQVYTRPVVSQAERWLISKFPYANVVHLPFTTKYSKVNLARLSVRTLYVLSTTGIAMRYPYFNELLAVVGAVNFWPAAIDLPVKMHFAQRKIRSWSSRWVVLQSFSVICLGASVFAFSGSFRALLFPAKGPPLFVTL